MCLILTGCYGRAGGREEGSGGGGGAARVLFLRNFLLNVLRDAHAYFRMYGRYGSMNAYPWVNGRVAHRVACAIRSGFPATWRCLSQFEPETRARGE